MKIKHQLSIFNALTRLLIIVVLWFVLPVLIQNVVYKHINKSLLEKKQKFIQHLDKEEINDYIVGNDSSDTYASYSMLHNSFLQLSRLPEHQEMKKTVFVNEPRIIEDETNEYRILQYSFVYEDSKYLLEIGSSLNEIKDLTFIIKAFIIILFGVVIILTFIVDTFYIEYLLKPFYKIINTKIRNVNDPDSFDHTPVTSHTADFEELDTVLNQMMNRIGEVFKNEKQFIANVSHELMTPISLLKNRLENLLQNESLDDNAVDKIAASLRTLDMLKKIINNLLLISKIENNQYAANEKVAVADVIRDLTIDLEDRFEEKNISLYNKVNADFEFTANQTLIHILLYNLIVNAIKYNNVGGSITISDGFENRNYLIEISDSGIGMNENQLKHIFERFNRISTDQDGQGLGLAIVHTIANFHNIAISVTSKSGTGTTFRLLFPSNLNKS